MPSENFAGLPELLKQNMQMSNNDKIFDDLLLEPFETWKNNENFRIEVKTVGEAGKVPIFVFGSVKEIKLAHANLDKLAKRGILVHVNSKDFLNLKSRLGVQGVRALLKPGTSHNDKLGFDWSVPDKAFKADLSAQFHKSAYPGFLAEASKWHKEQGNTKYADWLEAASATFKLKSLNRQENVDVDEDEFYAADANRVVKGYGDRSHI